MTLQNQEDIVLTLCPFCDMETPPIGMAILLAELRARGLTARVIDLNAEALAAATPKQRAFWDRQKYLLDLMDPTRFRQLLPELGGILEFCRQRLLELPSRFIGFSTFNQNMRFSAAVAAEVLKEDPAPKIIFGGPSCLVAGERQWVGQGIVDAFVVGDGEEVLPRVMEELCAPTPRSLGGVIFTSQDDPGAVVEPTLVQDLDQQPIPDFSDHPLDLYRRGDPPTELEFPIVGSRGCFMTCAFCNERGLIKRYRSRSGDAIFNEMKCQHERFGVTRFNFTDAAFNGRPAVLERLAELLLEHGLVVQWRAQGIPRGDMPRELMVKLRRAGLTAITYGVESAAPHVLDLMRRAHSWLDPGAALRRTHAAGIEASINLMVGFPGETEHDFQQTLDFVVQHRAHIDRVDNIHPFFISPMSAVERNPAAFGIQELPQRPMARAMEWVGPQDNTYERRKERVRRLCQTLREHGIAFDEDRLNVYDQTAEVQEEAPPEQPGEPALAVDKVQLLGQGDEPRDRFSVGEPLTVLFKYRVCHPPVCDPLFRVQIFHAHRPDSGENMVFGSNTERMGIMTGPLQAGPGEARLVFPHLNMAGRFRVVAGVWPEEMAPEAFDIWQGPLELTVQGPSLVQIPLEVRAAPGTAHGPVETRALVITGSSTDTPGAPLRTGEALRGSLQVPADHRGQASVTAEILRDKESVHSSAQGVQLPGGQQQVELVYQPLNLLGGTYLLRVTVSHGAGGEVIAREEIRFQVRSGRTDGAGLAHHDVSWTVTHAE